MVKFYMCSVCGNLIEKIIDGDSTPNCCGRTMRELKSESTDGDVEKHVPVITVTTRNCDDKKIKKVKVHIGSADHPMEKSHHIEWIEIETDKGIQRKYIASSDKPCASFYICENETVLNAYAYCNLHGLYVKENS